MKKKRMMKLVQEGDYVTKVEVELIEDDTGWSPYLSVADACKLDEVREGAGLRRPTRSQPVRLI